MPTSQYKGVHIPNGCEVSIGDTEGSLVNMGVLDGDANIEINYDLVEYIGSMSQEVVTYIKNMRATSSFTMIQYDMDKINELMGGVSVLSSTAGTPVTGATQTVNAGWTNNKAILIEGQNSDGSAPTINSVTGSTSGAGTEDDDYILFKVSGAWYIALRTGGISTFGTSESVTINYDYTPAVSKTLTLGSSATEITPKIVEFKLMNDGKMFRARLWSAKNENGFSLAFPSAQNDTPATMEIQLSGRVDTARADKAQLIEIVDEIGV